MKEIFVATGVALVMLSGCGDGAPKCSDSEVQKLVKYNIGLSDGAAKSTKLTTIRMSSTDDKLKKTECQAQLIFSKGVISNIDYTAQYTDDGTLFVQVEESEKKTR